MKKESGKVILVVLVIYLIIVGVRNINSQKNDNTKIVDEVTIIENGKYDSKNNGKLVLISGKIDYNDEIKFDELDNGINSFKVERIVKKYTKNEKGNYSWIEVSEEENNNLFTTTISKEFNIGDFKIEDVGLSKIKTDKYYSSQEKIGNMEFTGIYYTVKEREESPKSGDLRVTYKYYDLENNKNISVLAKQTKDGLVPYKLSKNNEVYEVFSKEELSKELGENVKTSSKGKIVFILIVLGLGIFFIVDSKRKSSN